MRRFALLICVMMFVMAPLVCAQDLDSTAVSDQFDSAARGNESTICTTAPGAGIGSACVDGSDATTITDSAGVTGSIDYINGFAGASAYDGTNGETPVLDITAPHKMPDRNTDMAAIAANTRPGATSANNAVVICDDGGHNGLYWGEADDSNYFVQADVFCEDRSGELTTAMYEAASIAVRAASREGDWIDYSFNTDRTGSYAIVHDRVLNTIEALKWSRNLGIADIISGSALADPYRLAIFVL